MTAARPQGWRESATGLEAEPRPPCLPRSPHAQCSRPSGTEAVSEEEGGLTAGEGFPYEAQLSTLITQTDVMKMC